MKDKTKSYWPTLEQELLLEGTTNGKGVKVRSMIIKENVAIMKFLKLGNFHYWYKLNEYIAFRLGIQLPFQLFGFHMV